MLDITFVFRYNDLYAKESLSAEEEKESTKAWVSRTDGYPRLPQGAETQKAHG